MKIVTFKSTLLPNCLLFLLAAFFLPFFISGQDKTDSLLNLLQSEPRIKHAIYYNKLASIKFKEEKFRESADLAHKALQLSKEFDIPLEQYYALINKALVYFDMGEFDSSILFAKDALHIAEKIEDTTLLARAYNTLGNSYKRISAYDISLQYYLDALRIVEDTLPDATEETTEYYKSLLLNNIGTVYKNLGQAEKSFDYYKKSLKIRIQQNDSSGIATCLQNIGVYYEDIDRYDSAILLFNEAYKIRESLKQEGYAAELLMNLGTAYTMTGNYLLANENLQQAIHIFERLDKKRLLSFSYLNMAKLCMEFNLLEKALPYIQKSISLSNRYDFKDFERDGYEVLAEYYTKRKDFQKAYESKQVQMSLSDSLSNMEMTAKVVELQTRYDIEKKDKEIEILVKDKEIQLLKIRQKSSQVYFLIFIAILFVLLFLITLLLLNRRMLKQKQIKTELEKSKILESKLKEENAYQSKQLTTHALNMLQKNKLLQEMDNDLRAYTPKADDAIKAKLNSIRRQINRNMNSEKEWDLFKLYFEEVNKEFYTTLQCKCSDLTPGDLRLAALIKLNLNIKEAAAVLNISPESMKKARYRLRQKLGLYERENLGDYLSKIC